MCVSVCLSVCLSVYLSVCLSVCLFVCLPVCVCVLTQNRCQQTHHLSCSLPPPSPRHNTEPAAVRSLMGVANVVSGGTTVAFDTPFAVTPQIKLSVVAYCCSLAPPQVSSIVTQVTAEGASFVLPAPYTFVRIVYHASRSGQYHPPLPPPPVFRLAYIVMCTGWETLTRARTHTFHSPPLHLSTSPTIPPLLLPSPLHLSYFPHHSTSLHHSPPLPPLRFCRSTRRHPPGRHGADGHRIR